MLGLYLRRTPIGVFLLVALLTPIRVLASNLGFQPVSPDELHMKTEPGAPGAPAVILYREVDRDDNSSTPHEDQYVRIKILTDAGRKYADVEIPFVRDFEQISNLKARSIAPDGTIADFNGKPFEKIIVKAKGIKYLAKVFTLPNIQAGSIIEYYYTIDFREDYVYDTHWVLEEELFTRDAKFSLKPYDPSYGTVNLHWSWRRLPPGTNPPVQGSDQIIRLEARNIPAFELEDFMPPPNELKARVDFVYSFTKPEPDQQKFWLEVGKRRNQLLDSFINKKGAMQSAVAQIVSPSDLPQTKLQKIYARVQQLKNTSYEPSKTQQEEKRDNTKANNNVEDIWKRGYGNGVELTWLYLALVRAAGFQAYGVWVSDRNNYFFDPTQMDSRRLDANVVLVLLDGKEIYCDPGAKFAPFGLLPWYETGVLGLRLDSDGGAWIHTPLPDSSVTRIVRKADLKLLEDGSVTGKLTLTCTGLDAMQKRTDHRDEDDAERKKYLEDHVKEYISSAADVELQNHPDWDNSASDFVGEFKITIPGWAMAAGKRTLLPVGLFSAGEKGVFEHSSRVHPVYFDYPYEKLDDLRISLPDGWEIGNLPSVREVGGKAINYSLKISQDKNTVEIARALRVAVLIIGVQQYPALRGFFQAVRTGDDEQVLLQAKTATASN